MFLTSSLFAFGRFSSLLAASLCFAAVGYAGTVSCNNNPSDAALIQSALNAAGSGATVTITGTCALGSTTLSPNGPVTINGSATLNYTGSGFALQYGGDNLTVTGLTFNGGGIEGTASFQQGGWTITNNNFQNITSGSNGIQIDNEFVGSTLGKGHNSLSNNHFTNIWQYGYPNYPPGYDHTNCGTDCIPGTGIFFIGGGLDDTDISGNSCNEIGFDCIKGFLDEQYSNTPSAWSFVGHNITIQNNVITNDYRIGIEFQGVGYGGCKGGCNYNFTSNVGTVISGNYWHAPTLQWDTFAYSLVIGGYNNQYINNTAVDEVVSPCYLGPAIGIEDSGHNGTITQGNVIGAISTICSAYGSVYGWAAYISNSYGVGNNYFNNNVTCGGGAPSQGISSNYPGTTIETADYTASICPNDSSLTTSSMTISVGTSTSASGVTTFPFGVVSNLSVRSAVFAVDGTQIGTQTMQDVSSTFASDKKWLYHTTVTPTAYSSGSHTLTATFTDVSGATSTASATFFGAGAGAPPPPPLATLAPSSLSFGTVSVGSGSTPQTVMLTNSGSSALTISNISVTGSNAGDFGDSSSCGSSVASGASCTIVVTFSPSVAGSRSASLSVSDNATGSPQSISLSGTGTTPVTPPVIPPVQGTLPTNLPTGMILWLANDAGIVSTSTSVNQWTDMSGLSHNAVQLNAADQPLVVNGNNGQRAVRFDGNSSFLSVASLPINGDQGMSVFIVSSSASDPAAGFGANALLSWGETAYWGTTFFGDYQSTSHFRFGTTQAGNEVTYQMPLNLTNSFGLGEWIHAGTVDAVWLNGQSLASYTGKLANLAGIGNTAYLGGGLNGTFYAGDVSEVIVYSRGLSTSERQAIEQYLMGKYHL